MNLPSYLRWTLSAVLAAASAVSMAQSSSTGSQSASPSGSVPHGSEGTRATPGAGRGESVSICMGGFDG